LQYNFGGGDAMPKTLAKQKKKKTSESTLIVRLDRKSKVLLKKAAERRGISVSDFVRIVTVEQARREVEGAKSNVIVMTPDEQLAFWNAVNEAPVLTKAQKELGAIMRGEA
jgi:uncharacterized protein (DUF1778 family)